MFKHINEIAKANVNKTVFNIPFRDLEAVNCKEIAWACVTICSTLESLSMIDWEYYICYDDKNILYYRKDFIMRAAYTIEIPYGERSRYFDAMIAINDIVGKEGTCTLYVNNIPYRLESLFVVDFDNANDKSIEYIEKIIKDNKLILISGKRNTELIGEMQARKWNLFTLPIKSPFIKEKLRLGFLYPEKSDLRAKGYDVDYELEQPKLFISYSHKDSVTVHDIVKHLKRSGLNVWIDEQEIDLGENILQRISDGIRECDFGLLFLSNNTLTAKGEMHEILTFFQKTLYSQKKIIPILLDSIEPDSLIEGLGMYKYFAYTDNNINDLSEEIRKVITK